MKVAEKIIIKEKFALGMEKKKKRVNSANLRRS